MLWVRSAASSLNGVSIAGRSRGNWCSVWCVTICRRRRFKLFQVRRRRRLRAGHPHACRFTGELGYEIWTTPDYFASLYDDLWDAGREAGLVHFGGRAVLATAGKKAYGSFNKDFRPDYTPG